MCNIHVFCQHKFYIFMEVSGMSEIFWSLLYIKMRSQQVLHSHINTAGVFTIRNVPENQDPSNPSSPEQDSVGRINTHNCTQNCLFYILFYV